MPKIETSELSLHQKLLKIADAAGVLRKTKSGYNYRYVPEEDIQAKVTGGMQKYNVMLYHSIVPGTLKVQHITYEKYDAKSKTNKIINEFVVTADSLYTWVNVDKPDEKIQVPWALVGQMEDASQAFGSAETYCNRYFLMKSLQLATSEADPDEYRSKQKEAEQYEFGKINEQLAEAINLIKDKGTQLIASGIAKEIISGIVAKHNADNPNPSGIKSLDICDAIITEFDSIKSNKTKNTTVKEK